MKLIFTTLCALLVGGSSLFAQERYTSEVYSDAEITVDENVQFAINATILGKLFDPNVDEFLPEPLFMDVYQPDQMVDTETDRPVVMVIHGGDNLPRLANNACWGDKRDSVTVTTARKLARMGYVAIAPNYRLGWNPLATEQDAFLDGLVDASFRTQQDIRAAVRWLRKDIAEDGNQYNIASDRFAVWGTSSSAGTYAAGVAYLNSVEEIQTPTFFVTGEDGVPFNTFNLMEAGNLEGTEVGVNTEGDTTNYINTPGYTSEFQLAALGSGISLDPGAVDEDEPPMIMFGNPVSPVTSVLEGPIQLPTTGQVVAFVQLSQGLIKEAVDKGLNDEWVDLDDEFTRAQRADPIFGDVEGWLPLYGDPENEYPWVHWDEANCPRSMESFDVLPGANRPQALAQIDTMAGYFGVRACVSMGLSCPSVTSVREVLLDEQLVQIAPNPTSGQLQIETNYGRTIQEIEIHNVEGKLVNRFIVNASKFQRDNLGLQRGFYTVMVRFEDGVVTKKIVVSR